jgi:hypothetical protein
MEPHPIQHTVELSK